MLLCELQEAGKGCGPDGPTAPPLPYGGSPARTGGLHFPACPALREGAGMGAGPTAALAHCLTAAPGRSGDLERLWEKMAAAGFALKVKWGRGERGHGASRWALTSFPRGLDSRCVSRRCGS